jgi:hypothetical protein
MNGRIVQRFQQGSVMVLCLCAVLAFARPAAAASVTLCPSDASSQAGAGAFTFANVPGPLEATCGANSAVQMDIVTEVDYARLAWLSGDSNYPSPLTFGNLAGLSADVEFTPGQPGDQPFYMLAFDDLSGSLGQAAPANQLLFIEFQPVNLVGNTMTVDPNTTLFNLFDNVNGNYLQGGQADARTLASWMTAFPFISGESIDQLRIGIGLSGGGTSPVSLTINSLDVATIDATAVPEPATLLLFGTGLVAVARRRRSKSRQ